MSILSIFSLYNYGKITVTKVKRAGKKVPNYEKNVISDSDRARELQEKGVESRNKKKQLKERLLLALDLFTEKESKAAKKKADAALIKELGIDAYVAMKLVTGKSLVKDEVKLNALSKIWDRTDGKAVSFEDEVKQQEIKINLVDYTKVNESD